MSDVRRRLVDLSEQEARRALPLKWGVEEDVLPAWVAEMDFALDPVVQEAVVADVRAGATGYPVFEDAPELAEALAGFADRHWGWQVDPAQVTPTSDVTAGVRLVIDALAPPGALILPMPIYGPQLTLHETTGRARVDVRLEPDAERAVLDLDRLDDAFRRGGRVLVLDQPHNPWGRVFTREELEGVRDVVRAHDGFVVCDEIHAPLVLPGARHTSYLDVEGTADHAAVVLSTSKAFNTAGLRCAQVVTADPALTARIRSQPPSRNDSWSPLGVTANIAAYTHGDPWLASLVERLDANRDLLQRLVGEHLPQARVRRPEASFLAWLDLRAYAEDPQDVALRRGRVRLEPGTYYDEQLTGHARLNYATSPERLTEIVRRLGSALT